MNDHNALRVAMRMQQDAAQMGFDWPDAEGPLKKINEEFHELQEAIALFDFACMKDELGDLLFSVVNLARHLSIDPEAALFDANEKFSNRWERVLQQVADSKKDISEFTLEELDAHWEIAKQVIDSQNKKEG